MLESSKFFDSLQGKLFGILLGTLTFGAVVPTVLDYLESILYYRPGEHPVQDFWLISSLYFLLPVLSLMLAWPLVLKADQATYVPQSVAAWPPAWEHWARWLPVGSLALLASVFAYLFLNLSLLPGQWVKVLCLLLLLAPAPLVPWLWHRINKWLSELPVLTPADMPASAQAEQKALFKRPEAITWLQLLGVIGVPLTVGVFSLLLVATTFQDAHQQLRLAALKYAGKPSLPLDTQDYRIHPSKKTLCPPKYDLLAKTDSGLWQTSYRQQPIEDSLQAPFQARYNYEECQRLSKSQDEQYRRWFLSLTARADTNTQPLPLARAKQPLRLPLPLATTDSLARLALAAILAADSVRQLHQPRVAGQYLRRADRYAQQLAHLRHAPRRKLMAAHQSIAQTLTLESAFLERQAQEYYSLLLGQLQLKGRLWLVVLLNLLLWGWAALRVADEGYYRVWRAAQSPSPPPLQVQLPETTSGLVLVQFSPTPPEPSTPTFSFAQEQTLLQQFAFIAFGLLVPLLNPVKPENIALDKPLWSLALPSFVRTVVQTPAELKGGPTGATGAVGLSAVGLPGPTGTGGAAGPPGLDGKRTPKDSTLTAKDLDRLENNLKEFIKNNREKRAKRAPREN